ncbi:CASP-like protein 1F2, partial [Mucuna pruriens]
TVTESGAQGQFHCFPVSFSLFSHTIKVGSETLIVYYTLVLTYLTWPHSSPIKLLPISPSIKQLQTVSHMADAKDSSSLDFKSPPTPTLTSSTNFLMAHNILRILPTLLSAASIAVMVTNNQTVLIFALRFQAHFYYSPSLKFFVAANAVVAVSSLLMLIINFLLKHHSSQNYRFLLFLHDMVMTVLLIAGCAAASAIGYVGQFGEDHVGWQPICDHVRKFCKTNLVSLLLSYFAFFAYLGLTILSAYKCVFFPLKD